MNERAAIAAVTRVRSEPRASETSSSFSFARDQDLVAVEAPLLLRLRSHDGADVRPAGVFMRTPGHDAELAVGLLYAEGLVRRKDDVLAIEHAPVPSDETRIPTIDVTLASHIVLPVADSGIVFAAQSACGLCGRLAVAAVDRRAPGSGDDVMRVSADVVSELPASLREGQSLFAETGGLHAAGFFAPDGTRLAVREDIGRHNAVDKLVGAALFDDGLPARDRILVVSGRAAFEIVQKAAMAGVAIVVAVGAPSSLAIDAARAAQLTLVGFARDGRFNVYSGPERIPPRADRGDTARNPV